MPWGKGEEFNWTRDEAQADILQGRYGEENDDRVCELANFENGSRKFWADKLRALVDADPADRPRWAAAMREAAALLDPYDEKGSAQGFGRTEPVGSAGLLYLGPERGGEGS
jgi:hypothetical protein